MAPSAKPWAWRSHPTFILTVIGVALTSDMIIFAILTPVLPFVLASRINVPEKDIQSAISLSLAAFFVTSLATPVGVAFWGRHKGFRKPLYIISLVLLAASTVLLLLAKSLSVLVVARVMQGTSGSIVWVVGMGMVCDAVGVQGLGQATGTIFGLATVGAVAAPAIGGALYRTSGLKGITILSLAILVVDLVLRLLVVERPSNEKASAPSDAASTSVKDDDDTHADENTPLVPGSARPSSRHTRAGNDSEDEPKSTLLSRVPILHVFLYPAMWISIATIILQAIFISFVDSIMPLRLGQKVGFDAFQCGLMLLTISGTTLLIAPVAGMLVDRHGPRWLTVAGTAIVAIGVVLLGLPLPADHVARVAAFAVYLSILGTGLATLDSPAFVASAALVDKVHKEQPGLFGPDPPYVEHQAIIYTFYSLGMLLGPLLSAGLTRVVPFWGLSAVFASGSAAVGIASLIYL